MAPLPTPYTAKVQAHFEQPRHAGDLAPGPGQALRGEAGSAEEGIRVRFEARVASAGEGGGPRLVAVAWRAWGCPHSIAALSLAADWLLGRPPGDLAAVEPAWLARELGIPTTKAGRLLIIQDALRNCLADWENSRLPVSP
jgi:NifU-like protein involved in Fe-S cluster formation